MKNKNKKKTSMKMGIIVAILLLAVGFAAVSTVLVINGTIKIKPDTENFNNNVIFKTATAAKANGPTDANNNPTATIGDNGKSITFTTQVMKDIGETSTLTYTIENNSQYAAQIQSINCNTTTATSDGHVTITPADKLKGKTIAKGATSDADTITVRMIKSYVGATADATKTISFTCTITANAVEAS